MAIAIHNLLAVLIVISSIFVSLCPSDAIEFTSYKLQRRLHRRHQTPRQMPVVNLEMSSEEEVDEASKKSVSKKDIAKSSDNFGNLTIAEGEKKVRRKRSTFAWPDSSLFITQFSLEIPLYSPEGIGIPLLLEVPYEFTLPNVSSAIFNPRSIDERFSFYKTIESLFSRFGFDGRACVLRAVCERAESEVMTEGLLGEVLNMILAVSMSKSDSASLWEYSDAEHHGKDRGDCSAKYEKCPISIFHFFDH